MSQPKLTLRPPPNVDFVQGYPGIPPGGPDRPQAAVKGAIEVRVGPQGVKAKWVRIELRKIETLPGGGVANTFFDFVGQSPINLWQSPNDEYSTLHTNDFPFFIRIPESIPPTISLEKGAGIKYELIASICVQGKKGFLRRDKPTITATASTIIIDKHELHSTWPIYSQPETRTHTQDGVTLIVDRAHTCYGPGDRVVVMATVRSDTVHAVMLRGFEFMLRETTVFRAGPHTQGKKGSPQVKVASIGEQQVPVNATLSGGTCHKAELIVPIPSNHTSATINAARHIDITYVLTVKALMSTGKPVSMDLPVIISNWPRNVSVEAMRRIGHAFNVSLPGQPATQHGHMSASQANFAPALMGKAALNPPAPNSSSGRTSSSHAYSNSIDKKGSVQDLRSPKSPPGQFATSPVAADRNADRLGFAVDEFGSRKKGSDHGHSSFAAQTIGAIKLAADNAAVTPAAGRGGSAASSETNSSPAARPRSSNGRSNTAQRLTIANMSEDEIREHMEAEAELARRQPSVIMESPVAIAPSENPLTGSSPAPASKLATTTPVKTNTKPATSPLTQKWATAEDEKKRLYEHAVAKVERVQGRVLSTHETSPSPLVGSGSTAPPAVVTATSPSKPATQWETAAQEKARLYEQAQAAVARARSVEASSPASIKPSMSTGAALYADAMSAINKPLVPSSSPARATSAIASPTSPPATLSPIVSPTPARQSTTPSLLSAADEKAMLQRYYDAKNKVYQTQTGIIPAASPTAAALASPGPPAVASPMSPQAALSPAAGSTPARQSTAPSLPSAADEKAMLQRYYEAKTKVFQTQTAHYGRVPGNAEPVPYDALYPASQQAASPTPSQSYPQSQPLSPPPFQASGSSSQHPILSEKERLRRHFEAQDAAARQVTPPPQGQWQPPPPQDPYPGSPPPPHAYPQAPLMAPMSPDAAARLSSFSPVGSPPPFSPSAAPSQPLSAFEEKEMLRRRYEMQDSAQRNSAVPPTPPPRASQLMNGPRGRPPPTPPSPNAPGSARPLTAAEEKARLKAMYEAEDRQMQRSPPPPVQVPGPPTYGVHVPYPSPPPSNGFHSTEVSERSLASTAVPTTPPPPPPLAPKPPREYIEETRAEDLRTSAKLQAIDNADPSNLIASLKAVDPDLASIATTDLRDDDDGDLDGDADPDVAGEPGEHTFGPGALSAAMNASAPPSRSNTGDSGSPGASGSNGIPLSVPPPPPLPPKVLVAGDSS
ncbi:hypothetical protein C8Q73DRAFT_786799 [Cubamyces lactineus]|nr:hypothetical protein C8Q73DRAFT_786799 [Cubamyces lactineus]